MGMQSTFTEPTSGPTAATGHTLDEIYDLIGERAPVAKTGVLTWSVPGEDGYFQRGVAWPGPRFTDNLDGTVTDKLTGLIWLKDANCYGQVSWYTAITYTLTLNSGGCGLSDGSSEGDWRMPNLRELHSLVAYGRYGPALPSGHPFTDVQSDTYWSSTTGAINTIHAWYVRLTDGYVYADNKTFTLYIWPVRGGQ
jgi:hypothetical protein